MDILVGLDYDTYDLADEEIGKGHFTIVRKGVSIKEIVDELKGYLTKGHYYPQFTAAANPEVVYAYDLNKREDADIYDIINNELIKAMEVIK
jgi:hypothetical protein